MLAFSVLAILKTDLQGRGMPGTISILTSCALAVNLALNWVLIPRFGIEGAAMSSSVAYVLALLLVYGAYRRVSGRGLRETFLFTREELRIIARFLRDRLPGRGDRPPTAPAP